MSTMSDETRATGVVDFDRSKHAASKDARIAAARPLLHQQVRVTAATEAVRVGQTGVLESIDYADPVLTFFVRLDSTGVCEWVFDVEPVGPPAAAPAAARPW